MTSQQRAAIRLGIIPRAARLPADIESLLSSALLASCPVVSVERRARKNHIAALIAEALEGN